MIVFQRRLYRQRGGTFSLEGTEGKAFHTRSRVFTDQEWQELQAE